MRMKILILGGTRFIGRQVAETLVVKGHDLILLSHRKDSALHNVRHVCEKRDVGLSILKGERFNLVLDFICYDKKDLEKIESNIVAETYVLISSIWVPRLWSGKSAVELKNQFRQATKDIPQVTLKYLNGKLGAEQALLKLRKRGYRSTSLRLPIVFGQGDHTGRTDFYVRRIADGRPLIAVEGGQNYAQIAELKDLAHGIVDWIHEANINDFCVWEAIPDKGRKVREIIESMADSMGKKIRLIDVSKKELKKEIPSYLEAEPLWRESALPPTTSNIFNYLGKKAVVFGKTKKIQIPKIIFIDKLRIKESIFLENRQHN